MKILILAILLVSECVCADGLPTMKLVRKIKKWVNHLRKEQFEEANRNGNLIFKDKGLNIYKHFNFSKL
jgi:hypothetical protein